jgi:hypothetical protein
MKSSSASSSRTGRGVRTHCAARVRTRVASTPRPSSAISSVTVSPAARALNEIVPVGRLPNASRSAIGSRPAFYWVSRHCGAGTSECGRVVAPEELLDHHGKNNHERDGADRETVDRFQP